MTGITDFTGLPLGELRRQWQELWVITPHPRIGRKMLEISLSYKIQEKKTGGMSAARRARLDQLLAAYRRNKRYFDENVPDIKPGTQLVRQYKGQRHTILVEAGGYRYEGKTYSSLSEIAFAITNTRWNGWVFFGLKQKGYKKK